MKRLFDKIEITVVDHRSQRYPTVGDWQFGQTPGFKNVLFVKVSNMNNWKSELAVAVHEVVEALLCEEAGVKDDSVTQFDLDFEEERNAGKHGQEDEPGDDPRAPYRKQHLAATKVEEVLCDELGIRWIDHDANVNKLP